MGHDEQALSRPKRLAAPILAYAIALVSLFANGSASAADAWVATWTAAQQGAFAVPKPAALYAPGDFQATAYFPQPDVIRQALPGGGTDNQTFRLILRPDLWEGTVRVRFSNVFGKETLAIRSAGVALQRYAADLVAGTGAPITFGGAVRVTIPPGQRVFSDPVRLPFVTDADRKLLEGRKLAVSFAVEGKASAISYHDSAYQTSYISPPGSGDHAADADGAAFPFTTTSWFVVDAIDALAPEGTAVVVAVGDSITDGTFSTNNVDDRWPDALAARLHAAYGDKVSVVNAAINANAVTAPMVGEALVKRLDRDLLGVSGVKSVVLLEGVNDLGALGVSADGLTQVYTDVVAKLHAAGVRVIGGTLTPTLNPDQTFALTTLGKQYGAAYGGPAVDKARRQVNDFIRSSGTFDSVIDFEKALINSATGAMKAEYAPDSMGGPGDYLHPNHGGYRAMAEAADLSTLLPLK
jgi:lysophospholipase L1-like esterase